MRFDRAADLEAVEWSGASGLPPCPWRGRGGQERENLSLVEAPTAPESLSGNRARLRELIDRLDVEVEKCRYLGRRNDLVQYFTSLFLA